MAKTISTTLGEVIVVEMDPIEEDSGYRWNLKWIPAGLQFLEQQVLEQEDDKIKQRFLFLSVTQYGGDAATIVFVLQSDDDLNDVKDSKEIKVDWNANLQFVSYNPNIAGADVSNVAKKYGFPRMTIDDQPFLKHRNMAGGENDYCGISNQMYGYPCFYQTTMPYEPRPLVAYGYPCATQTAMPYGMVYGQDAGMKYGYPCMTQAAMPYGMVSDNTAMIYGFPVDAGMKYGYACTAQTSMPYGYGWPNYDGK